MSIHPAGDGTKSPPTPRSQNGPARVRRAQIARAIARGAAATRGATTFSRGCRRRAQRIGTVAKSARNRKEIRKRTADARSAEKALRGAPRRAKERLR
jgi:hypothetical protein